MKKITHWLQPESAKKVLGQLQLEKGESVNTAFMIGANYASEYGKNNVHFCPAVFFDDELTKLRANSKWKDVHTNKGNILNENIGIFFDRFTQLPENGILISDGLITNIGSFMKIELKKSFLLPNTKVGRKSECVINSRGELISLAKELNVEPAQFYLDNKLSLIEV